MGKFTPAYYYSTRNRRLRCIVVHTMEAPEGPNTAENIALYFASGSVRASAHVCVDQDSLVECLPASATAWAAPGLNADGYQIEHAGYAGQGAAEWDDEASRSMLALSAAHARRIADAHNIPLVHLTDEQLAAGAAGFVGHDQVSRVYKMSDHWDPGQSFPWDMYMSLVRGDAIGSAMMVNDEMEMKMQIITTNFSPRQYLLNGDGTMVHIPNEEYLSVAKMIVERRLEGINKRQWDILQDLRRRINEARKEA